MTNNMERFEQLYRRYFDRTVAFIKSLGLAKEDARDLAQETFVRVYRSMERYRGDAGWAYIQTAARRCTLNKFRDDRAHKRNVNLTLPTEEELLSVVDRGLSPEQSAAVHESLERAEARVRELPDKKRACVLWFLAGYSYREIAQVLGISEVTVKSRLHEARHELKLNGIELPWPRTQNGTSSTSG